MLEHHLYSAGAAAEPCKKRESRKNVDKAKRIVHQHSTSVGLCNHGAVIGHQSRKYSEEGYRCIVGDNLYKLEHYLCQSFQESGNYTFSALRQIGGKAKEQRKNYKRQHCSSGKQPHKITCGKEIYQHVGQGGIFTDFLCRYVFPGLKYRRKYFHQNEHNKCCNRSRNNEYSNRGSQNFACPLPGPHSRHRT